jgi:hypothetical protein
VSAAKHAVAFQQLSRLIEILKGTPFIRMGLALISGASTMSGIECCGVTLAKTIDDQSSAVLEQLMDIFAGSTEVYKTVLGYK